MKSSRLSLRFIIPQFGTEFVPGKNCSAIKSDGSGAFRIEQPKTEEGYECIFDLHVSPVGWAQVLRESYECQRCGKRFKTSQGLAGHMSSLHSGDGDE